jgi:hypothetical protein
MANYTKRKLMELLEALPEDAHIGFVAAHDMVEGDIFIPLGEFDPDHPNNDCFFIGAGDPDIIQEIADLEVTSRG